MGLRVECGVKQCVFQFQKWTEPNALRVDRAQTAGGQITASRGDDVWGSGGGKAVKRARGVRALEADWCAGQERIDYYKKVRPQVIHLRVRDCRDQKTAKETVNGMYHQTGHAEKRQEATVEKRGGFTKTDNQKD